MNYIIEFVYRGEVDILGEKLTDFCQAAHSLGVLGRLTPHHIPPVVTLIDLYAGCPRSFKIFYFFNLIAVNRFFPLTISVFNHHLDIIT